MQQLLHYTDSTSPSSLTTSHTNVAHPLLSTLSRRQLRRHALLHLPAVSHDGLQDGDGAGAQRSSLRGSSRAAAFKVPLERQEGVGQAVVTITLLEKHLLPLSLEKKPYKYIKHNHKKKN